MPNKSIPIIFDFSLDAYKKLEELQKETNKETKADVLQAAMSAYCTHLDLVSKGYKLFYIRDSEELLVSIKW